MTKLIGASACALLLVSSAARAEQAASPRSFWITPYLGVSSQGEYYEGLVVFSDGDADFLRIDPDSAVVLGLRGGYHFTDSVSGYLGLSRTASDAAYVENDNPRPDVDFETIELDLGALVDVAQFPMGSKPATFGVGGGLSYVSFAIDGLVWDGELTDPSDSSIGLHLLGALDVGVSELVSIHGHLQIGWIPLQLGDLEEEIARADNEAGADLDGENFTYFQLGVGVTFRL